MTGEENKAVVRRFYAAFEANDAEGLKAVLSPDLVAVTLGVPEAQDRDFHLQGILGWNAAFDTRFTIEEQIATEETVASRVRMQAVHNKGPFQGVPPTGTAIRSHVITVERVADGRIVERRVMGDPHRMAEQIRQIVA